MEEEQDELSGIDQEWLKVLYQRYADQASKDNQGLWTVTGIFIPLSLAGLSTVKDGSIVSTSLLAVASIILTLYWYLACERAKKFQNESWMVIRKIERKVGFKTIQQVDSDTDVKESQFRFSSLTIQKGRKIFMLAIIGVWIVAVIATCFRESKGGDSKEKETIKVEKRYFLTKPEKTDVYSNRPAK